MASSQIFLTLSRSSQRLLRNYILKLRIVKVCIEPILRKQFFMVALLDDISVLHDKNQIRITDLILVMKDGDIVEQGNHEELLAKGGFYADLYNSQFENAGECA